MRVDSQPTGGAGVAYRRRRRSVRQDKVSFFRHKLAGKVIAGVVALMAIADLVGTAAALHASSLFYGLVGPGMSADDVLYAMGQPAQKMSGGGVASWLYRQGGSRFRVDFTEPGLSSRATCSSVKADSGDCPDILGIHLGTGEDQLWYTLGAPDRQSYAGETKTISYSALGLTFGLRRYQVVQISLASTISSRTYLERLPRVLVP